MASSSIKQDSPALAHEHGPLTDSSPSSETPYIHTHTHTHTQTPIHTPPIPMPSPTPSSYQHLVNPEGYMGQVSAAYPHTHPCPIISRPHPGPGAPYEPEILDQDMYPMFPMPRFAPASNRCIPNIDLTDIFSDYFLFEDLDNNLLSADNEQSPPLPVASYGTPLSGTASSPLTYMHTQLTPPVPQYPPQPQQAYQHLQPHVQSSHERPSAGKFYAQQQPLQQFFDKPRAQPRTQQSLQQTPAHTNVHRSYGTRGRSVADASSAVAGTDINAAEVAAALQDSSSRRKRKTRSDSKFMTEQQKLERRERNREHAKRSRIRKKVLLDTLQAQMAVLRKENVQLRHVVKDKIPDRADEILQECTTEESFLLSEHIHDDDFDDDEDGQEPRVLMEPDYRLIQALLNAQQNFVVSDPALPDNPIVYASRGFLTLTGYTSEQVLGRNCRFLQGPNTDPKAVDIVRRGVADGRDTSVCLLNYKRDGTPFWNQFFVAALRNSDGRIVNYVGVQCEVNTIPIDELKERVKKLPIPEDI